MVARALGMWCGELGRRGMPTLWTMRDAAGDDLWPHHFTADPPAEGIAATVRSDGGWLGALTGIEAAGRGLEACAGPALWPAWSRAISAVIESGKPMPWVGRACRVADRTIDVDVLFLPVDDGATGRTILLGFLKFDAVS